MEPTGDERKRLLHIAERYEDSGWSADSESNMVYRYASTNLMKEMNWWIDNGYRLSSGDVALVAMLGNQELLDVFKTMSCPWKTFVANLAAMQGSVKALDLLVKNGCPWSSRVIWIGVSWNHLEVVKWAVRNGCLITQELMNRAFDFGRVEVIDYLRTVAPHLVIQARPWPGEPF